VDKLLIWNLLFRPFVKNIFTTRKSAENATEQILLRLKPVEKENVEDLVNLDLKRLQEND